MASKELTNEVAAFLRTISVSSDNGGSYDEYECKEKAEELLSTIFAALQEPTGEMKKVWDDDMSDWIDERIEDPYHPWKIMLNASPLGEQSE